MWGLGIKPRSSGRATNAPKHWAISPAPMIFYFWVLTASYPPGLAFWVLGSQACIAILAKLDLIMTKNNPVFKAQKGYSGEKKKKNKPTWLLVFFILFVQPVNFLYQLPFFTTTRIVDKIPSQDFLQLAHTHPFYLFKAWQVRQRGSHFLLGEPWVLKSEHLLPLFLKV